MLACFPFFAPLRSLVALMFSRKFPRLVQGDDVAIDADNIARRALIARRIVRHLSMPRAGGLLQVLPWIISIIHGRITTLQLYNCALINRS